MSDDSDRRRWRTVLSSLLVPVWFWFAAAPEAQAIPGFARKHDVKCYNCHTIPPVLNKTGYLYKRFGYRLPPDYEPGTAPKKLSEVDRKFPWRLTDASAFLFEPNFSYTKAEAEGEPGESRSSFAAEELGLFFGGHVPETNFGYFVEAEVSTEKAELAQAVVAYATGKVNSSVLLRAGKMLLQEGEGTRGAVGFSLFPSMAPVLEHSSPVGFTLDHAPVGVHGGYTWASSWYRHIVTVSAKLTNGVNEEGEGIAADATRNFKDFWFNADWWFGPDGGVTFLAYRGEKDQEALDGSFRFRPALRRYGVFGNYLFFDKLDLIGGYLKSEDDWRWSAAGALRRALSHGYRGELDYYFVPGLAVMGRWDRIDQEIEGGYRSHLRSWAVGAAKALTQTGNIVLRGSYQDDRGADPFDLVKRHDRRFMLDVKVAW